MSNGPVTVATGGLGCGLPFRLHERFAASRFFRGERAIAGPVTLTHRRIFILPTRSGWGLALLLSIQFLIAVNYVNNLALALTFLLTGVAVLSALHAFRNLAGLCVYPGRAAPVFAGEPAIFEVHIDNPSRLPRFGLHAHLRESKTDHGVAMAAKTAVKIALPAKTQRRGLQAMSTLTVSTTYPLGLFRAWSPLNLTQRVVVYPHPSSMIYARPPSLSGDGSVCRNDGGDDDFDGFHDYRPGDSLKRVHWRGLAKGQGLQVKHYAGCEGAAVDLDWKDTPGLDTEMRLSILCRWVLEAECSGASYGLRLPSQTIAVGSGEAHRHRCLEALAMFGP